MYLNVIGPIDNVSCYILRNIPAAHSFDRKPHGQKTVRIFPEYFTVHKVTPAADDLSQDQPWHTQISQPERVDLLDPAINEQCQECSDHTAVDRHTAVTGIEDA